MRIFILISFFFYVINAENIHYKMIVSTHIETEEAAKSLYDLEKFFYEKKEAHDIKSKYNLLLGMEMLDKYVIITLKPVQTNSMKNQLRYLLQEKFPESFFIKAQPIETQSKTINIQNQVKSRAKAKKNEYTAIQKSTLVKKEENFGRLNVFWKELDREWLGLLFLALAGFILIYRSAKQITKIKKLQEKVTKYQAKIEGEVDRIGEKT